MILERKVVISKNKNGFIIREKHKEKNKSSIYFVYVSAGAKPFTTEIEASKYMTSLNKSSPIEKDNLNKTKLLKK